jgi:carboxymethylenebutenolidase
LTDDDLFSSRVEYTARKAALSAFLCRPNQAERLPGLILIQEWWGLTDHIKEIARRLAKEGYAVLAPDLYSRLGNIVTKNGAEAAKLMRGLSSDQTLSDLIVSLDYLKGHSSLNPDKIGVIGFCMGGSYALRLACRAEELRGAVAFYGEIPADAELQELSAPLLFIWGEEDGWIQKEEVQRLKEGLKKYKKAGEVKTYPGAPHAFFNDTRREVFQPDAAKDAWKRTLAFFNRTLKS